MEDDWDLHAVVRGCAALSAASAPPSTTAATTSAAARSSQAPNTNQLDCSLSASCFEDLFEPRRNTFFPEELHDLYRPFFPKPIPPLSMPLFSLDPPPPPPSPPPQIVKQLAQQTTQLRQKQPAFSVSNGSKTSASHNPSPRSKRRKSLTKKICHVSAENLSSDVWSWRKYGQKPIKGSPYPRGYYKCSTSKGCMARKQVERNRSDPGMFIVTYTAEHNHPMPTHRNSLAGSTRQKPADPPTKPSSSSPELSPAPSLSPAPEKLESSREEDLAEAEDEDDEFSVSKMALDDDFFDGLEDFSAAPDAGDFASGHLPGTLPFPWLPATATTTAGGG